MIKEMGKHIYSTVIVLGIVLFVWLFASWVDVITHNDPFAGENNYQPWNLIVVFTEVAE